MSSSQPRIAIIGGGPAGLTLGVLLHKRSIPFTIFELRHKPSDEQLSGPCGSLDLHEESGIAAIKECGLWEEFLALTGECSEAQKVADKDGTIIYEDDGGPGSRPEISRHSLSKLLFSHIPVDNIQWGRKVVSVSNAQCAGHNEIVVDFGPQGQEIFDLVIGADGSWSKVRSLLTKVKPEYSGVQNLTVTIQQATTKHPQLSNLVGPGSFAALGNRHGVITQRGPRDSIRAYVILSASDENLVASAGLTGKPAALIKDRILEDASLLGPWGPVLKELVRIACDEDTADNNGTAADIRPIYRLPVGDSWDHKPGATLIGDAAHLMGPWAGEGVNLAMWDSLLLSRAIAEAYDTAGKDAVSFRRTIDPLLSQFEEDMVARAKEKAAETLSNEEMMFGGDDGAARFAQFFKSFQE